jgi:hypothetical protein
VRLADAIDVIPIATDAEMMHEQRYAIANGATAG